LSKSAWRRTWGWVSSEWFLVVAITVVAAGLRLVAIDRLPPGLYRDEGYNGLDALRVLDGHTPVFFPANNGREPLYIYLLAVSVAVFGPSAGALRVVSAVLGVVTVPLSYFLGRETSSRRVGLVAAWLTAVSVWTVNLSRVAFRAVAGPPLVALSLALLWRGLKKRRVGWLVLAGAVYGVTFYTYLAARFTVVAMVVLFIYLVIWHRRMAWLRGWLFFGLAALLVASPLAAYILSNWPETIARAGQVSILNPEMNEGDLWGTLAKNLVRAMGLFVWRGDSIPRHNVPLRPVFDPLVALAFVAGLISALRGARKGPSHGLAIVWLGVMLLPTALAEDAPHMLRASGVLPVVYLLPAIGVVDLWKYLRAQGRAKLGAMAVGLILCVGAVEGNFRYFEHLSGEMAYWNYETAASDLAAGVNEFLGVGWSGEGLRVSTRVVDTGRLAYVAPRLWDGWPSVRYLCDPAWEQGLVLSDLSEEGLDHPEDVLLVVWPFEDCEEPLGLLPTGRLIVVREGSEERGDLETESRLLYVTVRTASPEDVPRNVERIWEEGIALQGCSVQAPSEGEIVVDLYWRAEDRPSFDYTVFVHLLEDGILVAQHDGSAAGGYYPTSRWRTGDVVEDRHALPVASTWEPENLALRVGLYRWDTMDHLHLLDGSGNPTEETGLYLGVPLYVSGDGG